MPAGFISWGALTFVLRTDDPNPIRLAPEVRRAIWAINPNIVISEVVTMRERVAAGMRVERDSALLFGLFALAALVMAAIGVYGVAAYAIAQRTKEIGVRVALGAARTTVVAETLRGAMSLAAIGIAIGLGIALAASRVLQRWLFDVSPLDASAFIGTAALLAVMALLASAIPAARGASVDPVRVLRAE
jgi:ABC-type antimicrobial peptide transport system permease subunit